MLLRFFLFQVRMLAPHVSTGIAPEVTQLAVSPEEKQLAAGHSDGTIRLWSLDEAESDAPAPGHKSGVSALRYSRNGALLASGGQDTHVVVWDVTSVTPLYRLQGHTGQVTGLVRTLRPSRHQSNTPKERFALSLTPRLPQPALPKRSDIWGACRCFSTATRCSSAAARTATSAVGRSAASTASRHWEASTARYCTFLPWQGVPGCTVSMTRGLPFSLSMLYSMLPAAPEASQSRHVGVVFGGQP